MRQVREWLGQQWTWHAGQTLQLQRAAVAKGYGLRPEDYVSPMPGSSTTVSITAPQAAAEAPAPAPPAGMGSWVKAALLGGALLATGAAGTTALVVGLRPGTAVVAPAPSTVPTTAATGKTGAWDAITEEQQPDGSWKTIKRERLVPPAATDK